MATAGRRMIDRCDEVVSALEKEIAALRVQYEDNQREIATLCSTNVKKTMGAHVEDNNKCIRTVMKNVNTQLAHAEMELNFLINVSGVEILQYCKKTEQKGEKDVCSHHLVGRCCSLQFDMTFVTSESRGGACWSCDVTRVNVHMDCEGHGALARLMERTEATTNVQGFFRTLSDYAEWCQFRMKTFAHCKERYSAAVRLPHGSSASDMVLVNPDLPTCEMILVWDITINEGGAVVPILDLIPKLPEEAIALDKTSVLKDAASAFKDLLQVFGIQGSIEKIIQSFCLRKDNIHS